MTNDQRKQLIAVCEEELTGDRRSPTVTIHLKDNITVVVNYCIKYGTGTGSVVSVKVDGDWSNFPSIEVIDSYLVVWGRDYLDRLSTYRKDVQQALDGIED